MLTAIHIDALSMIDYESRVEISTIKTDYGEQIYSDLYNAGAIQAVRENNRLVELTSVGCDTLYG